MPLYIQGFLPAESCWVRCVPGLFLPWVTSDLQLKYWAYVLSFLWKLTVILIQEPMLEI